MFNLILELIERNNELKKQEDPYYGKYPLIKYKKYPETEDQEKKFIKARLIAYQIANKENNHIVKMEMEERINQLIFDFSDLRPELYYIDEENERIK